MIQGGGWCTSTDGAGGAKQACSSRAATTLGSSKTWATSINEDVRDFQPRFPQFQPAVSHVRVHVSYDVSYDERLFFS